MNYSQLVDTLALLPNPEPNFAPYEYVASVALTG